MYRLQNIQESVKVAYIDNFFVVESNNTIGQVFRGDNCFGMNRYKDNFMQLGWDSVAVFYKNNGGLQLKSVTTRNESRDKDKNGTIYPFVVTRSVDTCTVVVLQSDTEVLFAHLDKQDLSWGVEDIKKAMPEGSVITGMCSKIIRKRDETLTSDGLKIYTVNDFGDDLGKFYGAKIKFVNRHINGDLNSYCGHFEFGIRLVNNEVVIFGDITYFDENSIAKKRNNIKKARTELFDNLDELESGLDKLAADGCCNIY